MRRFPLISRRRSGVLACAVIAAVFAADAVRAGANSVTSPGDPVIEPAPAGGPDTAFSENQRVGAAATPTDDEHPPDRQGTDAQRSDRGASQLASLPYAMRFETSTGRTVLSSAAGAMATVENLGPAINTRYNEIGPVISPDGRTLYFTRRGEHGDQDICQATMLPDGHWGVATVMPPPLSNSFNNYVEAVTSDGNTLLVGGRYMVDTGYIDGLMLTHRIPGGWSAPQPVRIADYHTDDPSVTHALSADGSVLLMSLDRSEGYGRQDIYFSRRRPDGSWSAPRNLGSEVNTDQMEFAPFLAADGVTLYFSSQGHTGYGDADVFVTRRLDATWTHWSEPRNLGPTINTPGWDGYYVVPASGDYVYFSTQMNAIGGTDIARASLPPEARPQPVALVRGRVTSSDDGRPVMAEIHYERIDDDGADDGGERHGHSSTDALEDAGAEFFRDSSDGLGDGGEDLGVAQTDPATGVYSITLPANGKYAIRAEFEGFIPVYREIDLRGDTVYSERHLDLTVVPAESGQRVRLRNVFFETGTAELRDESAVELDRLVRMLEKNPRMKIEIAGFADAIGDTESNRRLSEARARSVSAYLVNHGIDGARLSTRGYGEDHPIAPNATDEGRRLNRRVEFRVR